MTRKRDWAATAFKFATFSVMFLYIMHHPNYSAPLAFLMGWLLRTLMPSEFKSSESPTQGELKSK
jgi:hypothetical protein